MADEDIPCARKGCSNVGTRHPVILGHPQGMPEFKGRPLEMILGILVCDTHQASTVVTELVGDEGWARIVAACDASGIARPDRETLGLAWRLPDTLPPGLIRKGFTDD